ncbi:hypothetical protein PAXRUDRAFT_835423 [Paxillus rubicundulus Ve08.2h10]|uniref:Uncharacterized protein n=1 Tax=Paxillus rubicundulus Ve08.2h10 TaxID=930991 RepID=A0A0D0CLP1_9AGAM|nr:hypothetical protein PAXRUDRAFT_835423 [Paxillus rubicundulus Ve08.2h10]
MSDTNCLLVRAKYSGLIGASPISFMVLSVPPFQVPGQRKKSVDLIAGSIGLASAVPLGEFPSQSVLFPPFPSVLVAWNVCQESGWNVLLRS